MGHGTVRVLICDDNQLLSLGLKFFLEGADASFEVVGQAANGKVALEMAATLNPDVILMDIHMPEIDGIEAARKLKGQEGVTKILFLSSCDDEATIQRAIASGGDGFCLNTSDFEDVVLAIKSVSRGASWFHPQAGKHVKALTKNAWREQSVSNKIKPVFTDKELIVLHCLAEGLKNKEIASKLYVSPETIKTHVSHIYAKLNVTHRSEAIVAAVRLGFIAA